MATPALAAEQQRVTAAAARAAALQTDPAGIDRPHDAVVLDVAGDFATRQAGQLQPGDANPLARLFVLSKEWRSTSSPQMKRRSADERLAD